MGQCLCLSALVIKGKRSAELREETVNAPLLPILRDKSSPRLGARINRLRALRKGWGGWEHLYVPCWRPAQPPYEAGPPRAPSCPAPSPRSGFALPSCLLHAAGAVTSGWHGWCRGSLGGGQLRGGWCEGRGAGHSPGGTLQGTRVRSGGCPRPWHCPQEAQRRVPAGEGGTGKVARGGCGHLASPCPSRALVLLLKGAAQRACWVQLPAASLC